MVITLGNFSSVNGRTVLSGLSGSGLDVQGLTNSLAEARRLPAVALEDNIELNNNKTAAFNELRGILSNLKDAANFLRNPPGVGNDADNVFRFRSATATSSSTVAASTYLSVSAEPGASVQNYNISEITSLARVTKQRTAAFSIATADANVTTADPTAGFFRAGTVTINGANITLVAGDTLNQVAAKFNEVKATTGIEAGVIQSGTNSFVLSFTATSSGTAAAFDLNDSGTVTSDPDGVLSFLSSSQLASFDFKGNVVTNSTFDTDISGYTDASLGTGSIAFNAGALELTGGGSGGNEAFAQQALTTEAGKQYTVSLDVSGLSSSAFVRIGSGSDVSAGSNFDISDYEVTADGTATFTFTATGTTTYLTLNTDANVTPITVDNLYVYEGLNDFSDVSAGTGVVETGIDSGLSLTGGGSSNEAFAQTALSTTIGQEYTITFDHADASLDAFVRVGTDANPANAGNYDLVNQSFNGDGSVTVTFTATSTTTYLTFDSATNTTAFTVDDIEVYNTTGDAVTNTQTATDAVFVIDGITVTRSKNTIADVVDGVTFNLLQATPLSTELTVDIAANQQLPLDGVTNFISAFNDLRTFVVSQSATNDDGTYNEEAYLAGANLLRSLTSTLATQLSATVSGAGTYTTLGEIGVTFADLPESADNDAVNNILNIDSQAFATALAADFDSVENLFGFSFTSSNANVAIFSSPNSVSATSFSLDIDPNTDKFQATVGTQTINLTATALGSSGYRLVGPAGSALEGLTIVYASTSAGTANLTVSPGIAHQIFNHLDGVLDDQEGQLQLELDALVDSSDRLQTQIDRIDDQVARYREQLTRQFSALEATLSSLNTLLQSIETNQDFLTSS